MRLTAKDRVCDQALFLRPNGDKNEAWSAPFIKQSEVHAVLDKLAAYEDAEEQGRLVVLPCKVGDALFVTDEGTILPAVRMVEYVAWHNGRVIIRAVNSRTGIDYYCSAKDFGKTVFLTREEAEAALKGGHENG